YTVGRRGIAGTVFVHKILGAAAEKGYSLDELEKLGKKVVGNLKTMGISLEPCTNLTTGIKSFDLAEDEVEIGLGIHGEPGTHREKKQNADEYVNILMKKILAESKINGEKVAVLVNGLGNTALLELFIANNRVADILVEKKIEVSETMVGNYMTAIDMSGFSISILKLDDEMEKLLKSEADTIALTRK
ncbi:MAG: dihydroxyacetone kinase subunit DhaK, partial [Fusobacteriaceae bacterium]